MKFFRQEYWSGLPFLPQGDLHDQGIELGSPALQADSLPSEPPGKPRVTATPAYQHRGLFKPEGTKRNGCLEGENGLSFGSTEFVVMPIEPLAGKARKIQELECEVWVWSYKWGGLIHHFFLFSSHINFLYKLISHLRAFAHALSFFWNTLFSDTWFMHLIQVAIWSSPLPHHSPSTHPALIFIIAFITHQYSIVKLFRCSVSTTGT